MYMNIYIYILHLNHPRFYPLFTFQKASRLGCISLRDMPKKYLVYRVWIHFGLYLDTMPQMLILPSSVSLLSYHIKYIYQKPCIRGIWRFPHHAKTSSCWLITALGAMGDQLQKLVLEEGCGVALGVCQNLFFWWITIQPAISILFTVHQGYRVFSFVYLFKIFFICLYFYSIYIYI